MCSSNKEHFAERGKGGDAAIRLTGLAVGQIAGSQIDSKVTNEAVKLAATSIIDQSIDTAKDQALKQNSNP
ncbi:hypothetical protein [Flavobacterium sp. C3NV]|uniref:hypothetical protein n=1 Tax=Flavobacterium sp. C3NV TaxID=3393358 RepID=UPI003990150B